MRMKTKWAFACVSLAAISHPAMAQNTPANEEAIADVETIVVQARRRVESVQEVPLVVNVVDSESIDKLNVRDGTEVQSLVPGLQLRNEANGIGASGQVRGVQFDITASVDPTVAFYLNDAYIDAGSVLQGMYDIGQVEVLRGPQGTLRGKASPSGSITFTTKKPVLDQAGVVGQATISDTGTYNVNGAFNVPIVKDILGIRVAGLYEESEANRVHSIDPDANLDDPYTKTQSIRVSALFKPTDWLSLEGMYQVMDRESAFYSQYASYSLANSSAPASAVLIRPRDRQSIQETASTTDQRFEVFNWRGELSFAGQKLIYQGSQTELTFKAVGNSDAANFFNGRDFFQTTNTRSTLKTHEIQLQNEDKLFGMFDYVVGYYNTDQVSPSNLTLETPIAAFGNIVFVNRTPVSTSGNTKEEAYFGNVTMFLGDSTEISGGLRWLDIETPARTITIGTAVRPAGPAVNDEKLIYTASIKHKITPDIMVYASTGTSRRPGPTLVNPGIIISSPRINSFMALKSENSTSYEVGVKSSWLDDRLTLNLTAYHQKFDNYPYKITTPVFYQGFNFVPPATLSPVVQSGAQFGASVPLTVKGVEAEIGYRFSDNFNVGAMLSYSDGKIKNGLIPCNDLNGDGVPDTTSTTPTLAQIQAAYGSNFIGQCSVTQRSSIQSPFSAVVQAEYTRPVSGDVNMFARGLFTYNGNSLVEPTNAFDDLNGYGLLNLFVGFRDEDAGWEITFYGKNVTNTVEATRFDPPAVTSYQALQPPTFQTTAGATSTSTYSNINTTAPREFGINLRFALGSK